MFFPALRASAILRFHPEEVASTSAFLKLTSAPMAASSRITAPLAVIDVSEIPPVTLIPEAKTASPPLLFPSTSAASR